MGDHEKNYTLNEAHLAFARQINGRVWQLLEKTGRSEAENEEMIHAAHASLYHWLQVGGPVNQQRGEWLLSRVYTVLGDRHAALRHSRHCLELTDANRDNMEDFDLAYAYEAVARASALSGDNATAQQYRERAKQSGEKISGEESQNIFWKDFEGGEWYGLG